MGRECCGVNSLKNVCNIFNIIYLVTGFGILGFTVWTILTKYSYANLLASSTYSILVYFLLSAGFLVILVALMGCFAVLKENRPLLIVYIFVLVLIFLIEAMVGILGYLYEENIRTELKLNLNETFITTYGIDPSKTEAIDELQQELKCCGAESFEDWTHSVWFEDKALSKGNLVPDSCCKTWSGNCGKRDHPSNISYDGCLDKMAQFLSDHVILLSIIGLSICLFQIFGVIFACMLYFKLRFVGDDVPETQHFINNKK